MTRPAWTWIDLDRLRRDLRAALDKNGHVLPWHEFRRIDKIVARLDKSADEIEAFMTSRGMR